MARSFELCASRGRPGDAEAELKLAIEEGTRLAEAEPAVFDRWRVLVAAINALAGLLETTDRPRQAVEQYDRIAATFAPWTKLPGRSDEVVPVLIRASRRSARLLSQLGDHAGASHRLASMVDLCEPQDRPEVRLEIARERLLAGDHVVAEPSANAHETADQARRILEDFPGKP